MIIVVAHQTSQQRPHIERLKKISAHPKPLRVMRLPSGCQIEALIAPSEDARKSLLVIADLLPLRVGEVGMPVREIAGTAVLVFRDLQLRKFVRMGDGKRAQPDRIQQLKYRRICPDAEGQ